MVIDSSAGAAFLGGFTEAVLPLLEEERKLKERTKFNASERLARAAEARAVNAKNINTMAGNLSALLAETPETQAQAQKALIKYAAGDPDILKTIYKGVGKGDQLLFSDKPTGDPRYTKISGSLWRKGPDSELDRKIVDAAEASRILDTIPEGLKGKKNPAKVLVEYIVSQEGGNDLESQQKAYRKAMRLMNAYVSGSIKPLSDAAVKLGLITRDPVLGTMKLTPDVEKRGVMSSILPSITTAAQTGTTDVPKRLPEAPEVSEAPEVPDITGFNFNPYSTSAIDYITNPANTAVIKKYPRREFIQRLVDDMVKNQPELRDRREDLEELVESIVS